MYLKTVIILTFIYIGFILQHINASCHWREADLCLATLAIYGSVYGIIPRTEQELEVFCRYIKESHDCARDFARNCLTDDLLDSGYPLAESTLQFYDTFCIKESPLQKEWLQHAQCMSQHFNKIKPCTDYALAGIENLASIDNKDRYATLCCVFNNILECGKNLINEICDGDADGEKLVKTIARILITDIPVAACRKFEARSERCLSLLPPEGSKSKGKNSDNELVKLAAEFISL